MDQNVISFTEEEILGIVQAKKKSTGISISTIDISDSIKVHGKVSRGINIEFDVICNVEGVTDEELIINLIKIKILGLPLSKNMIMKYLESNFKTNVVKFEHGKILASKSAIIRRIPELKGQDIKDIYIKNNTINIRTGETEEYFIG